MYDNNHVEKCLIVDTLERVKDQNYDFGARVAYVHTRRFGDFWIAGLMDLWILLLLIAEFRVPRQIPKKIARAKAMGDRRSPAMLKHASAIH